MNTDLPPEFDPPPLPLPGNRTRKRKSSRQSTLAALVLAPIVSFAVMGVPEKQREERARSEASAYATHLGGRCSRLLTDLETFALDYASTETFEDEVALRGALSRGEELDRRCVSVIQEIQNGGPLRQRLARANFDSGSAEQIASEFRSDPVTRDMLALLSGSLRVLRSTAEHRGMLLDLHGHWETGDDNDVWFDSFVTKRQVNEFNQLAETVREDARRLQGVARRVQGRPGR
ncbi:MAG: hypothetical protein AAF196_09810 [Planctomycetota bacterium]